MSLPSSAICCERSNLADCAFTSVSASMRSISSSTARISLRAAAGIRSRSVPSPERSAVAVTNSTSRAAQAGHPYRVFTRLIQDAERDIVKNPSHLLIGVRRERAKGRESRDQGARAERIRSFADSKNQDRVAWLYIARGDWIKAASRVSGSAFRTYNRIKCTKVHVNRSSLP